MSINLGTSVNSSSHLGALPVSTSTIENTQETRFLEAFFATDRTLPGVLVLAGGRYVGMVSRERFLEFLGRPFGREVFLGRAVSELLRQMNSQTLVLASDESIQNAAHAALARDEHDRYEPVVVRAANGDVSLLDMGILLQAQSVALATEMEAHRRAQELLVQASRQAGMAEVATGVLHNVGNVLNSVTVSASVIGTRLKQSKLANLGKAASLIEEHKDHLGAYLTDDEKGKVLPSYLTKLAELLISDQQAVLNEVEALTRSVEHIREIVSAQQAVATVRAVEVAFDLRELIEDAIRINSVSFVRHNIEIVSDYGSLPTLTTDKHHVMQILINLISNAKKSVRDAECSEKRVIIRVVAAGTPENPALRIDVIDNGEGIAPENLTRIFQHGFTTRRDGHGFGLHNAANTARQLGGSLSVASDGPGCGATFTFELPLELATVPA